MLGGPVVRYTPASGYLGADAFAYAASDVDGAPQAQAIVTIQVVNHAPVAVDDPNGSGSVVEVDPDSIVPVVVNLTGNDSDPDPADIPTVTSVGPVPIGNALQVGNSLLYAPPAKGLGYVNVPYTISDSLGAQASAVARLHLQVCPRLMSTVGMGAPGTLSGELLARWCADGTVTDSGPFDPDHFSSIPLIGICALTPVCVDVSEGGVSVGSLPDGSMTVLTTFEVKLCVSYSGPKIAAKTVNEIIKALKALGLQLNAAAVRDLYSSLSEVLPHLCRTTARMSSYQVLHPNGTSTVTGGFTGLTLTGQPRLQKFTFSTNNVSRTIEQRTASLKTECNRRGVCSAPVIISKT